MAETPIIPAIPGIEEKYLQIADKFDSIEKIAYMEGKDPKYFFTSSEFEVMRAYINKLRDDIDAVSVRPFKIVTTSSMRLLGANAYLFLSGDESKFIVVIDDALIEDTYTMYVNPAIFPNGAEFKVFPFFGRNYNLNYYTLAGPGSSVGNTNPHYRDDNKTSLIKLFKDEETSNLLINYLT